MAIKTTDMINKIGMWIPIVGFYGEKLPVKESMKEIYTSSL